MERDRNFWDWPSESPQYESGESFPVSRKFDDDDEITFEAPVILNEQDLREVAKLRPENRAFTKERTLYFRANYRRFLIMLFLSVLFASPFIYWMFFELGVTHPLLLTLFACTGIWAIASAIFYSGPLHERYISLEHFGIYYQDELRTIYKSWREVESIHLQAVEAFFNPYPLCYVRVVVHGGEEFAFANFGNHFFGKRNVSFGNPPYPIIDIRDADLLLALLLQQVPSTSTAPDLGRLRYRAESEIVDVEAEDISLALGDNKKKKSSSIPLGLLTLFSKIGLKWMPQGMKFALKTLKPGYLGASLGLYALIFQWQFALVMVFLLVTHELGHVWAMRRAGMRIRGVYMIPFFGAATVTEDAWPSWAALAKVSLAGPLWGAYTSIFCLIMYFIFPGPFWFTATLVGALLNLLNLLPIQPLDGGRILHAFAHSLRSSSGFILVITFIACGIVLGLSFGLLLLYILSLIGIAEFFKEYMLRQRAEKLDMIRSGSPFTARDLLLLKSISGINFGMSRTPHVLEREKNQLKRLRTILKAAPMTTAEMFRIGLATFGVTIALFSFLVIARYIQPHSQWAIDLFR